VGLIHPVTGDAARAGNQCREGALLAIAAVNQMGGIRSLGGMKLVPFLGDSRSRPEVGAALVARASEGGVSAIIAGCTSAVTAATVSAAAAHGIPHIVDVALDDRILARGPGLAFRLIAGQGAIVARAAEDLAAINAAAGGPARTVLILEDESPLSASAADALAPALRGHGLEVLDTLRHGTPIRDVRGILDRLQRIRPDILVPADGYDAATTIIRAMRQHGLHPECIYSVLDGAGAGFRFLEEYPETAAYLMDCVNCYDPRSGPAHDLKGKVEGMGLYFTPELFLTYEAVMLLADALEHAGSVDRAPVAGALSSSRWQGHFMPWGPTRFVHGQNTGARAVTVQVQDGDVQIVAPQGLATARPVFPMPA
jgi:branched-chain amino acid transport system substrate-binding protein